jgi:fructose-1,6-bisphosphatase/inositol monophosphatase family enzyme
MAQKIIEGSLHHHFPGLRIIGEEDIEEKDFLVKPYVHYLASGAFHLFFIV